MPGEIDESSSQSDSEGCFPLLMICVGLAVMGVLLFVAFSAYLAHTIGS